MLCRWLSVTLTVSGLCAPLLAESFELTPRHRLTFDGQIEDGATVGAGVAFGVLPTHPVLIEHKLNQWNQFEQHVTPAVQHPIATFRAPHVAVYRDRPDVSKLALDLLGNFPAQENFDASSRYVLVTNTQQAMLLTLEKLELPQDRDDAWKISGQVEHLKLPEHIDDPVADLGRAVEGEFPLSGTLCFGKVLGGEPPMEFYALNLSNNAIVNLAKGHSAMLAGNGTVIDVLDYHNIVLSGRDGRTLGQVRIDPGDITQFTIAADGQRFAVTVDRVTNVISATHETLVEVYGIDGRKLGQIAGYDDPAFFPDGRLLLTGAGIGAGLFIGDYQTGKADLIAVKDGPGSEAAVDYPKNPVVSPDGKWIAYEERNHLVALVGVDGRGWQEVWNCTNNAQAVPTFSPDSRYVAMLIQEPDHWRSPGTISVFDVRRHLRQTLRATEGASPDVALMWMP